MILTYLFEMSSTKAHSCYLWYNSSEQVPYLSCRRSNEGGRNQRIKRGKFGNVFQHFNLPSLCSTTQQSAVVSLAKPSSPLRLFLESMMDSLLTLSNKAFCMSDITLVMLALSFTVKLPDINNPRRVEFACKFTSLILSSLTLSSSCYRCHHSRMGSPSVHQAKCCSIATRSKNLTLFTQNLRYSPAHCTSQLPSCKSSTYLFIT